MKSRFRSALSCVKMTKRSIVFVLLLLYFGKIESARILGVFPVASLSHQIVFRALMKTLAERGHEIVSLTTDPVDYKGSLPNLKQIDVHDISYSKWNQHFNFVEENESVYRFRILMKFYNWLEKNVHHQLNHPEMKKILNDPEERFDLCFLEAHVMMIFPIKDRFNCSMILISSLSVGVQQFEAFGNPASPILYPDSNSPYIEDLNFRQRLFLTIGYVYFKYLLHFKILPKQNEMARYVFGRNTRPVEVIEKEADMIFLNVHPLLSKIRPVVPNTIFMGSLHLLPTKPLPKDLKKILDDSKNGVIYFSLGTNVKSIHLPQFKVDEFLNAFESMPYTVLWKWENDKMPGKPNNVHISKWFPQQDILAHPNVKLFITQGGQQSMEEAVHFKVPLIGIPFIADQFVNVAKFSVLGIGTELDFQTLSKKIIIDTITKIINDTSYYRNILKISNLIKDEPQTPMERAVWWTEYVIRNNGAKHLKSTAVEMPTYQTLFLDVIAFVLFVLIFIFATVIFLCKSIYKFVFKRVEKEKVT